MCKGDATLLLALELLEKHGPVPLTKLAEITGQKRDGLRHHFERHVNRFVTCDRKAFPALYKVKEGWREALATHLKTRDEKIRQQGVVMRAAQLKKDRHAKRLDTAEFEGMLSACMAMRPDVRTAWRGPAPSFAAA